MRPSAAALAVAVSLGVGNVPAAAQETPVVREVTVSPASAVEGDRVVLTARVDNPSGGTLRYTWDAGDGSEPVRGEALASLSHVYGDDGSFTVTVTVEDSTGATARGTTLVTVTNAPPEIRSLGGPEEAAAGESVRLEGAARDPGEDDVLTWSWDFGDGSTESGRDLRSVDHAFQEPGLYQVTLTVSDDDGMVAERMLVVAVERTLRLAMSGAIGGVIEAGFEGRPGFLVHGSGSSSQIPGGYCQLLVTAEGDLGTVTLGGLVPSPLRPGSFPILREGGAGAFRVQDMQCDNPDADCSNGLWRGTGVAGSVTLAEVSPEHVSGEVQAEMAFGDEAYRLSGFFASVPQRRGGVAMGLDPGCFPSGGFAVGEHRPRVDQLNVDPEDLGLRVTFTEPVDWATVSGETFAFEYRLPEGGPEPYRRIEGVTNFVDDRTVRFTPGEDVPSGILPCVRIRGGRDGVLSTAGDTLETPAVDGEDEGAEMAAARREGRETVLSRTAWACYGGGRPWPRAHEWGFATLVELDDARVELYQVARIGDGVTLVPRKSTAARVYPEWSERDDVHPDAQVLRFPARITVEAQGTPLYPVRERTEVRRPDRFDAEDRRLALNSINFFGWEPESSGPTTVRARVEPLEQEQDPPEVFDGTPLVAEHWDHATDFTFDYYYFRVAEWADSVPAAARANGDIIARHAEEQTTQLFPVVETRGRSAGDFIFGPPAGAGVTGQLLGAVAELPARFREAIGRRGEQRNLRTLLRIFTDRVGPYTDANALVAFVPFSVDSAAGSHIGWLLERAMREGGGAEGGAVPFRTVHVYPRGDVYLTTVLTHEFGHAFWLQHNPWVETKEDREEECARDRGIMPGIEGMRMAPDGDRGWSKSSTDGNAESARRLYPLMYPCGQRATESFITNESYRRLQEDMDAAIRMGFYRGVAVAYAPTGGTGMDRVGSPWEPVRDAGGSGASAALVGWGLSVGAGVERSARRGAGGAVSSAPRQEPGDVLLVSGFVGPGRVEGERAVHLGAVVRAPRATPSASRPDGPWRVVLRDDEGAVLGTRAFGLLPSEDPDRGVEVGYFSVSIPVEEGVREIAVESEGVDPGRRTVSRSDPVVRVAEPSAQASAPWSGEVRWEAEDPDGDAVVVSVLYSPTGQRPWNLLSVVREGNEFVAETDVLSRGPRPTLRLVASDGVRQGEDRVPVMLGPAGSP